MTQQQSINIDSKKLFNLGANMMVAGFVNQTPENAKKLFKDLKQGDALRTGSEYRGQFNFPNFELSLKAMLQKFQTEVRKDKELKELRTLTNETTGGILFNLPSGVEINGNVNVLMMAVEPMADCIVIKLMFVNPDQFAV
jgi:hypothetical protein